MESKLSKLLFELEREIAKLEDENNALRSSGKESEISRGLSRKPTVEQVTWVELESGKRFLTKKELAKYLGISAGSISNQLCNGVFPIRHRHMGKAVRFDMKEILEYLETDLPFWERDKKRR